MKHMACVIALVIALIVPATGNTVDHGSAAASTTVATVGTNWTANEKPLMTQTAANEWVAGILEGYGLELPVGVTVEVTDKDNCGSELSADGTGGGCFLTELGEILVSPTTVGTDTGKIVLLHEYAHAIGFLDECAAEVYAHTLFPTPLWAYPECAE